MKITFNWDWKVFWNTVWQLYCIVLISFLCVAAMVGIASYDWDRVPVAWHLLNGGPTVYNVTISKPFFDELLEEKTNTGLSFSNVNVYKTPKVIPLTDRWKYDEDPNIMLCKKEGLTS